MQTIEQSGMLAPGDRVLAGVSGGPDSVALLHILKEYCTSHKIPLYVVHVNHRLRAEAVEEADYVATLAEQWNLPFRLFEVDVAAIAKAQSMSLEQAGHEVRFQCFREAMQQWNITRLALGHHQNDRAETLLLHFIHGCGLDGLASMPPMDGSLIRPLIHVTKEELKEYCNKKQLKYYTDATNLEAGCLRNRIRLELLPQLQEYNPQIVNAITRLQDSCSTDADYLDQQTQTIWQQWGTVQNGEVRFPLTEFQQQHKAIQQRLLRKMLALLTGNTAGVTYRQIQDMMKLTESSQGSRQLFLGKGVRYVRQYDRIVLRYAKKESAGCYEFAWNPEEPFELKEWPCTITMRVAENNGMGRADLKTVTVDAECLAEQLIIRNRKAGDTVQPIGMQGHKSLKKYMIEKKVPADIRNIIPMIESNGEIIWIPGLFLAEAVKITANTKKYAVLQYFQK